MRHYWFIFVKTLKSYFLCRSIPEKILSIEQYCVLLIFAKFLDIDIYVFYN